MLSEFNIDQIALTDKGRKDDVRKKFEHATEIQQRVVKAIKKEDELTMREILTMSSNLFFALNQTYTNFLNTNKLTLMYKMPNILNENWLKNDLSAAETHNDEIYDKYHNISLDFQHTRQNTLYLTDILFDYDEYGQSKVLEAIQHCIDRGLDGSEDPADVCDYDDTDLPFGDELECDDGNVQNVCFFKEDGGINQSFEFEIFRFASKEEMIDTATEELTNLDSYKDFINVAFLGKSLNAEQYPAHSMCLNNLEYYEKAFLPQFITFINSLNRMKNVSNLQELKNLILDLEAEFNSTIGPGLLRYSPEKGWEDVFFEAEIERLNCSWDLLPTIFFSFDLHGFEEDVSTQYASLTDNFDGLREQLSKLLLRYNEDLVEYIQEVQTYLDEKTTKKTLAEAFTDVDLIRTLLEIDEINSELATAIKQFESILENFQIRNTVKEFYSELTRQPFPYLTNETEDDFTFLQEMIRWYKEGDGRQLIESHMQNKREISDLPENTNFTMESIWEVLHDAVLGFEVDDMPVSGLQLLVSDLTDDILYGTSNLLTRLDEFIHEMTEYEEKISINTHFYM